MARDISLLGDSTMKTRNGATVLTVLLAFCGAVDARPLDRVIGFNLHKTIGDLTSPIDITVTMGLMIEAQYGESIGWEVMVVTIREFNEDGDLLNTWSKFKPIVDTTDGLWWIQHANPASPVNSEFLVPPRLVDTAGHVNPTEPALEFDIEGAIYVAPPEGAPFEDTASLTTFLQQQGDPEPKKEEREKPVEVPPWPESPFPT